MTGIINSYPSMDNITTSLTANIPSTSLYRYDFSSPIWAPNLAGFSILLCLLVIILIILRILAFLILRVAIIFIK